MKVTSRGRSPAARAGQQSAQTKAADRRPTGMRRRAELTLTSSHYLVFFRAAKPQVLSILRSASAVHPSAIWMTEKPARDICMAISTARLPSSPPQRGNAPIACRVAELNVTHICPLRAGTRPPICPAARQFTSWSRALSNAGRHHRGAGPRGRRSTTRCAPDGARGCKAEQGRGDGWEL